MTPESRFVSKALGPLPIINAFLDQLRLEQFFHQFVPARDPRLKLAPAEGLGLMLYNILIARRPLYAMSDWAIRFDEQMLGLPPGGIDLTQKPALEQRGYDMHSWQGDMGWVS